jgi:hypothetical protein
MQEYIDPPLSWRLSIEIQMNVPDDVFSSNEKIYLCRVTSKTI